MYWFLAGIFALPAMVATRIAERHRKHVLLKWLYVIDQQPLADRLVAWTAMVTICLVLGTAVWLFGTHLVPPVVKVYLN